MRELLDVIGEEEMVQLKAAFTEIQQPRTDFELKHFVVQQHDTEPQQYAQCVLEMQMKFMNVRRALITKRRINAEIEALRKTQGDLDIIACDIELKEIDLEDQELALMGALREFRALYALWKGFEKRYTRQELNAAQAEYWKKRLTRQANADIMATGRIGVGNIDALRLIGMSPVPALDHVRDVEKRALESGDLKILIVVATEKKAVDGLPCIEKIVIPSGVQYRIYNVWGRPIDDAYNDAVSVLLADGAEYMFTVEDDTFPEPDALKRLLDHARTGIDAICGWYPKRSEVREGAPIVIGGDGKRTALMDDGGVHEVFAMPMGCTLIRANLFLKMEQPWFATTTHLTQDTFFSQKLRDIGVKPLCDTSIKCKHIDRETHQVYS